MVYIPNGDWSNMYFDYPDASSHGGSGGGGSSTDGHQLIVSVDAPGGDDPQLGDMWLFVRDESRTTFAELEPSDYAGMYTWQIDEDTQVQSWKYITCTVSESAPSSGNKVGNLWIKLQNDHFNKIYLCTSTEGSTVWSEVYPDDETGEGYNLYVSASRPLSVDDIWVPISDAQTRKILGLYQYKYNTATKSFEWVLGGVNESGGGVGENVGQHNERFNGYTAADGCTITGGDYNHAEGYKSTLNGCYRTHVGGGENTVSGCQDTIVSGNGNTVYASNGSVVEGYSNTVSPYSGSSVICDLVVAQNVEVRGSLNIVTGNAHHLYNSDMNEVSGTGHTLSGTHKNIVGGVGHTLTGGHDNIVGGSQNTVTGVQSIVSGNNNTVSSASAGCVGGYHNIGVDGCFAVGYGATTTGAGTNPRFLVGGSGAGTSLYIQANGEVFGGQYHTGGADYAELFEWSDGNTDNEDRRGMLVALDEDRIVPANGDDIFGIISSRPSIIGNNPLCWHGKYKKDIFGSLILDENGEPMLSDEFDPDRVYIPREQRPEWAAVGLTGRLIIIDDGSCKPNGYVSAANGIGTASQLYTRVRALRRIDKTHIEVIIK